MSEPEAPSETPNAAKPPTGDAVAATLQKLAFSSFTVQAFALLVQRQQRASAMPGLGIDVASTQRELQDRAAHVSQTLLPSTLSALTDADRAANLAGALRSQIDRLADRPGAAAEAAKLTGAVGRQFEVVRTNASDAAAAWGREAEAVSTLLAKQRTAVTAAIGEIEGPGGVLAKTDAAIAAATADIGADVDAAVRSGKEVGDGVKSIVTGTFTTVSGLFSQDDRKDAGASGKTPAPSKTTSQGNGKTADVPGEPAKGDATTTPRATPAAPASADGGNAPSPIPLEGIAAVQQGLTAASGVLPNYKRDYAKLAEAYQRLAQANAGLAVLRAIEAQGALLGEALTATSRAAGEVASAWGATSTEFDAAAGSLGPDGQTVATFRTWLDEATDVGWSRLGGKLAPFQTTFAGLSNAIPARGDLFDHD